MKKILIVFGTRPEAIKMAPLVQVLSNKMNVRVCVTGQHRKMLDQVLELFKITSDYDLDIMKPGQDLFDVTSRVLLGMKRVLIDETPDIVLVHGDTTTAMATTLAAFYKQIPVGHVEAGLRTYNNFSPFPEEINRQIIGRLAKLHFVPTQNARQNLLKEYVDDKYIFVTGNTVIDALLNTLDKARKTDFSSNLLKRLPFLNDFYLKNTRIILVTGHRRENIGLGFHKICQALKDISKEHSNVHIVYPVHLNPSVREPVNLLLTGINNIHLINPLDYLEFVKLMDISYLILTDSGGIQEEAPSLGKPVLVMRDTTERQEAIEAGTVKIVGTDRKRITNSVNMLLKNDIAYKKISKAINPYGDGSASKKICKVIEEVVL